MCLNESTEYISEKSCEKQVPGRRGIRDGEFRNIGKAGVLFIKRRRWAAFGQ